MSRFKVRGFIAEHDALSRVWLEVRNPLQQHARLRFSTVTALPILALSMLRMMRTKIHGVEMNTLGLELGCHPLVQALKILPQSRNPWLIGNHNQSVSGSHK